MDLFTADPHFGHENIIKHCKRPFSTAQEMDEQMILNWNSVVDEEDTVWMVGDIAYRCSREYAWNCLSRLKGKKMLVRGNHESIALKLHRTYPKVFESVYTNQIIQLSIENQEIVLCHYAMRSWHHDLRGTWHLYGHTHNLLPPFGKSMDVGVDAWNFFPVSFEKVKDVMDRRPIGPHPGFEGYVPDDTTVVS